ncbi:hypothetical protein AVA65_07535 [Salmonella enterica subsp. enterica serovar Minnesota]|nr:hypothetical protein [Salmonella enterica subsp. enterica serovar Minnesota]
MAVIIHWKPVTNADKIRVYQSKTRFEIADIAGNSAITMVEIPGTELSKAVTIPRNTVNWFVVSAVDAEGSELFGEVFPYGNFPNTGPGPETILRGNWDFGLFGELSTADFFTNQELGSGLLKAGATIDNVSNGNKVTTWFKCIVNGKIIFIPNTYIYLMPEGGDKQILLNQRKLSMDPGFPNAAIINKNGNDFMYRLPSASRVTPAGYISTLGTDDTYSSEAGMIAALETGALKVAKNSMAPGNQTYNVWESLADMQLGTAGNTPMATANYGSKSNSTQWGVHCMIPQDGSYMTYQIIQWYYNSYVSYGSFYVMPILELVF